MSMVGGPEQYGEPVEQDLYAEMAEEMLTVGGYTASVQQLGSFCPIDITKSSVEARNSWLVEQYNSTGATIPAHVEDTFNHVSDRLGLERTYRVAEPAPEPTIIEDARRSEAAIYQSERVAADSVQQAMKPTPAEATRKLWADEYDISIQQVLEQKAVLDAQWQLETNPISSTEDVVVADVKVRSNKLPRNKVVSLSSSVTHQLTVEDGMPAAIIPNLQEKPVVESPAQPRESYSMPETETVVPSSIELPAPMPTAEVLDTFEEAALWPADVSSLLEQEQEAMQPQVATEAIVPKSDMLLEVLSQPPKATLEHMSNALQLLIERSQKTFEAPPLPQAVMTVTERLMELDEDQQEIIAPLMQELVGALHGLQLVLERGEPGEVIQAVRTELEALCTQLFEALAIQYGPEDIRDLLGVLLDPEFMDVLVASTDVENVGTHEIKRFKQLLNTTTARTSDQFHNMIGMIALLPQRKLLMVS